MLLHVLNVLIKIACKLITVPLAIPPAYCLIIKNGCARNVPVE